MRTEAAGTYYDDSHFAALERFNRSARDLVLREAVCLFSVCTNAPASPREYWRGQLRTGLSIVNETLR